MIGQGIITETSTTGNLLALEGTPVHANASSGTSMNIGPFTTTKAALIVIVNTVNNSVGAGNTISSITGGGLTWAKRVGQGNGGTPNQYIEEWTASAAAPLAGVTFTINYPEAIAFSTADLFAFSGNNTSTIYDGNASIPANSATDPLTVSTNNANDVIIGGFRAGVASPTQGAGYTLVSGADFQLVEYKIVSATQSNLSVSMGTGVGTSNGCVADAVMSA